MKRPVITYEPADDFRREFPIRLRQIIDTHGAKKVCDVGGGARPAFSTRMVQKRKLEYTVLDISAEELERAPAEYRRVVADIADPELRLRDEFDLVFSKEVIEHVADPRQLHRNIRAMLRPGGRAVHFYPTLFTVPFVANMLLPEKSSEALLSRFKPDRPSKFPAYYRWCRGPVKKQLERFASAGFLVEEFHAAFGHNYYTRVPFLDRVERSKSDFLVGHPMPALTSYAYVVLRRLDDA